MPQLPCPPGGYFCDDRGNKIAWYPGFEAEVGGFFEFVEGRPVGTRPFAPGETWEQFWDVPAGPVRWSGDDRRAEHTKKESAAPGEKSESAGGGTAPAAPQGQFGPGMGRGFGSGFGAGPAHGMGAGEFAPGMQGPPGSGMGFGAGMGGAWNPGMGMGGQQPPFGNMPGGWSPGMNPEHGYGGGMPGARR